MPAPVGPPSLGPPFGAQRGAPAFNPRRGPREIPPTSSREGDVLWAASRGGLTSYPMVGPSSALPTSSPESRTPTFTAHEVLAGQRVLRVLAARDLPIGPGQWEALEMESFQLAREINLSRLRAELGITGKSLNGFWKIGVSDLLPLDKDRLRAECASPPRGLAHLEAKKFRGRWMTTIWVQAPKPFAEDVIAAAARAVPSAKIFLFETREAGTEAWKTWWALGNTAQEPFWPRPPPPPQPTGSESSTTNTRKRVIPARRMRDEATTGKFRSFTPPPPPPQAHAVASTPPLLLQNP